MKINPTTLSWTAPTTNVDGSPIDYELEYEVGIEPKDVEAEVGYYKPIATIPGQLRANERYEAPISELPLEYGENTIALRSFKKAVPELVSQWSDPVTFMLQPVPERPLELRVT
ncbi:hypothetical protein [Marinobacter sp. KMM 10035]|uniref:hypothetical protein n=1 Tax=Marinobacter sp. KMM 10035 TaxID=3134034 RepID=UPI00397CB21A